MGSDETLFVGQREGRGGTAGEHQRSWLPNAAQTAVIEARTRKINRELQLCLKLLQRGPVLVPVVRGALSHRLRAAP